MTTLAPSGTEALAAPVTTFPVLASPKSPAPGSGEPLAGVPIPLHRKRSRENEQLPAEGGRWRAVEERDRSADGTFVFAVTTTGIYCRPSCPARRPRPENVRFFDGNAAARAAGFRPCKRCLPDDVLLIDQALAKVRVLLDAADGEPVALARLGEATGMSPFHLQREFKRRLGMSPKRYSMALRAERLKREMKGGRTVLDSGFEAGYGSASRLYADSARRLGMTPGRFKDGGRGIEIRYAVGTTPVGAVLVAATAQGHCAVRLGASADTLRAALRSDFPKAELVADGRALRSFLDAARSRVARVSELELATDLQGTAFQALVWEELRRIPAGETRSYSEIARAIGRPRAVRAVARACATNPVALFVPCHRVVGSDGALTGYRWGVQRKKALLAIEAAPTDSQRSTATGSRTRSRRGK
jgi:AraC family transcriptional regulator of adaptative response/methylated-DNA-[protein]-cysteine methyltransferase